MLMLTSRSPGATSAPFAAPLPVPASVSQLPVAALATPAVHRGGKPCAKTNPQNPSSPSAQIVAEKRNYPAATGLWRRVTLPVLAPDRNTAVSPNVGQ